MYYFYRDNDAQIDLSEVESLSSNVQSAMDPRLQMLVAQRRMGISIPASASTDVDEVAVIARVNDERGWHALSEVRDPVTIGTVAVSGEVIVTGRLPIIRIERVRELSYVLSLKAAVPVRPTLSATTSEMAAQPNLLPGGHQSNGGQGVVVGVVDYGGDFAHQNFRKADGKSRLLALWDQNAPSGPTSPFGYGREFTHDQLNMALNQANPYQAIGYDPADFDDGTGSHGTHVMDIAAGNGRGSGIPGVAPAADLMFVNITHSRDPRDTNVVGESFGDSVTLLEALKYCFDKAGGEPCVVNVSLGTNGGPHDGTTLVEQGVDALLTAAPNRAVSIAASNSFDDGIHADGVVPAGGTFDLDWELATQLFSNIELEIWYQGADRFGVELIGPNGATLLTVAPGASRQLVSGSRVVVFIASRLNDPNNHDNMIGIFLGRGMPPGTYKIRLQGQTVATGQFHAWIERDNSFQSQFRPPHDNTHTIGSISCGNLSIAVGSYDAHVTGQPLSYFSSEGPTRRGGPKPDVSAPGHNVWAAKSSTSTGVTRKSGTSMAAPAVAGVVALMFAEARARSVDLPIADVRNIIIASARRNPPTGGGWHGRYGAGRVSASAAVQGVIDLAGAPVPAAPAALATAPKTAKKKKASREKKKVSGKRRAAKKKRSAKKKPTHSRTSKRAKGTS